jgi:hypothetical protein
MEAKEMSDRLEALERRVQAIEQGKADEIESEKKLCERLSTVLESIPRRFRDRGGAPRPVPQTAPLV